MSAQQKPRGGQASELSRLKLLDRAKQDVIWSWRSEIGSDGKALTNLLIRNRVATQFGVRLERDGQLSEFWRWYQDRVDLEDSNSTLEQFEEFLRSNNKDWPAEKVRDEAIKFFIFRSVAKKDPDKFATIISLDQNERHGQTKARQKDAEIALAREKHEETKKADQQKALELCLDESKQFPDVQELFKAAFAALKKAKGAKK